MANEKLEQARTVVQEMGGKSISPDNAIDISDIEYNAAQKSNFWGNPNNPVDAQSLSDHLDIQVKDAQGDAAAIAATRKSLAEAQQHHDEAAIQKNQAQLQAELKTLLAKGHHVGIRNILLDTIRANGGTLPVVIEGDIISLATSDGKTTEEQARQTLKNLMAGEKEVMDSHYFDKLGSTDPAKFHEGQQKVDDAMKTLQGAVDKGLTLEINAYASGDKALIDNLPRIKNPRMRDL